MRTLLLHVMSDKIDVCPSYWEALYDMFSSTSACFVTSRFDENTVDIFNIGAVVPYRPMQVMDRERMSAEETVKLVRQRPKYDLIIAGQTPRGEHAVRLLRQSGSEHIPAYFARFSMYYGRTNAPYHFCQPPVENYDFDLPKDYHFLFDFLNDGSIQEAIKLGRERFWIAMQRFNMRSGYPPILEFTNPS